MDGLEQAGTDFFMGGSKGGGEGRGFIACLSYFDSWLNELIGKSRQHSINGRVKAIKVMEVG